MDSKIFDPFEKIFVAPPTLDPGASMLIYANGIDLNFKEKHLRNRWTAIYLQNTFELDSESFTLTNTSKCAINFPGSLAKNYTLVDSKGAAINLNASITFSPPQCDSDLMDGLLNLTKSLSNYGEEISNVNQAFALQELISTIRVREAFMGCYNYIAKMVNFIDSAITFPGQASCIREWNDPQWGNDPCCNYTLALTQCCYPVDQTVNIKLIGSLNESMISNSCHNPSKIKPLISNYAYISVLITDKHSNKNPDQKLIYTTDLKHFLNL